MALSRSALSHLDSAYNLFQKVSDHVRAGKILVCILTLDRPIFLLTSIAQQPILAKLKERAQMAQQAPLAIPPPVESATRLSFFSPTIKSENVELSALGGMTRLVSRRPSSSPSVSSASPPSLTSNPSSSPTISESRHPFVVPSPSDVPHPSWPTYAHIQNLNVSINMSDAFYANGLPVPAAAMADMVHQADASLMYQMAPPPHGVHQQQQQHSHQQHQQHQHQHQQFPQHLHHPSHSPGPGHSMALEMQQHGQQHQTPFFGHSFGGGGYNGGPYMMSTPSPEMMPPSHDPQDSWHNFMSQYKT